MIKRRGFGYARIVSEERNYERNGYAAGGRVDRRIGDRRSDAGGVPEDSCAIAARECTDDELGSVLSTGGNSSPSADGPAGQRHHRRLAEPNGSGHRGSPSVAAVSWF